MTDTAITKTELLALTSEIVSSHVANNTVSTDDLTGVIESVFAKLSELAEGKAEPQEELVPAVPIKKSVSDDYIVCLEDGKKLKMLKRHLKTRYNMSPDEYRKRWGLPDDYPMVAPAYAKQRSNLAKKIGLGTKPRSRRG